MRNRVYAVVLASLIVTFQCCSLAVLATTADYQGWSENLCVPFGETSNWSNARNQDSMEQAGVIEVAPKAEISPQEWMESSVSDTVTGAYSCVLVGNNTFLETYFTDDALANLESQMSPVELLNRYGPRSGYKLESSAITIDGRLVVKISFEGPIGQFSEKWVFNCSSEGCLIDAVVIPSGEHSSTPIATIKRTDLFAATF